MKICRFDSNRIGIVEGDEIADVTAVLDELPAYRYPVPLGDVFIERLEELRPTMESLARTAKRLKIRDVSLLSPVANPGKIIGIGRSYKAHAEEAKKDPTIEYTPAATAPDTIRMLMKANTALVGPSHGVELRFLDRRNDPEVEFAIVIGKRGTDIPLEQVWDHVAGYSIGLDMTLRGPELACHRKSIDTYAVLGPWMVTADEFGSPADVNLRLSVNGELRQNASTKYLVYDVPRLIEFTTSFYTLMPGDIIYTGTPAGVGPVKDGDTIEAEIAGIGAMKVRVSNA